MIKIIVGPAILVLAALTTTTTVAHTAFAFNTQIPQIQTPQIQLPPFPSLPNTFPFRVQIPQIQFPNQFPFNGQPLTIPPSHCSHSSIYHLFNSLTNSHSILTDNQSHYLHYLQYNCHNKHNKIIPILYLKTHNAITAHALQLFVQMVPVRHKPLQAQPCR